MGMGWDRIRELVSAGLPPASAGLACGLPKSEFWRRYRNGERDAGAGLESEDAMLWIAVQEGRTELSLRHMKNIGEAAEKDWKASAWILSHSDPEAYGREGEVSPAEKVPIEFPVLIPGVEAPKPIAMVDAKKDDGGGS